MSETWVCSECEATITSGKVADLTEFNYYIYAHVDKHGCTCDIDSNGNRAKCARCKWYED